MAFGGDEADAAAKSQLETLFPGRDVYMLDASSLWKAGGGIHCVTNDQPFVRPLWSSSDAPGSATIDDFDGCPRIGIGQVWRATDPGPDAAIVGCRSSLL